MGSSQFSKYKLYKFEKTKSNTLPFLLVKWFNWIDE